MQTFPEKLIINKRFQINGNSLVITVIIALVLGILSSLLILLAYYNRNFQKEAQINEKLERNLQSGIALVLADTSFLQSSSTSYLDLFNNQDDSVVIQQKPWGIYKIAIVRANDLQRFKQKKFLYGSMLPSFMNGCLYLVDHDRVLSLVGSASLTGNAYLSKGGLRAAYIDQRGFDHAKLIEGKILSSEKFSPPLNNNLLQYLTSFFQSGKDISQNIPKSIIIPDTLNRSFDDSVIYLQSKTEIDIKNTRLNGQIIIESDTLIELESSASLENIMVVAPVVRVKSGFSGTIQIIASDSIILEENCNLRYPSALILLKDSLKSLQSEITIGQGCRIDGGIYSLATAKDINKTRVTIKENSIIEGIIYVNGYLFLKGNVIGSVLTDYFLFKSGASIFENHLVDITINRNKLSPYYVGSLIFAEQTTRKIIQWVN